MSDTAQVALAVLCYLVAVLAQLTGIALLAREGRRSGRVLRRWQDAESPDRAVDGRHRELSSLVEDLLSNRFDRTTAVILLIVGVVAGALGNFLSL